MKNALIIFAKAPIVGKVKTRLAATVGDEVATSIFEKLLHVNIERARQLEGVDKLLYAYSKEDAEYFKCNVDWPIYTQVGVDLGERMRRALVSGLQQYDSAVLVGTDIADAQDDDYLTAFDVLDRGVDIVIGPTFDGGYWLIGSRGTDKLPFSNIDWGSSRVFNQTVSLVRKMGLSYHCLPTRHDVDVESDLAFFDGS